MAVDKITLSGSTNGRSIKVANTASPGTLIHTGPSANTSYDEVWIYVHNPDTTLPVTLQWGGTTSPDDNMEWSQYYGNNGIVAENGLYLFVSGLILRGNSTPLEIRAFTEFRDPPQPNPYIFGFVNRIS